MIKLNMYSKVFFNNFPKLWKNLYYNQRRLCHGVVQILASPRVSMVDVAPEISVQGLSPGSPVTLIGELVADNNKMLSSQAHYFADENGSINVKYSKSVGGSYTGVFPTGLISTLKNADTNFMHRRTALDTIMEPTTIKISVRDGHLSYQDTKPPLASINLERHHMGPGVRRIEVKEGRVRGYMFLPKGDGPFPGIIDIIGARGKITEQRAALNASRGFACLTLAYFNMDDIPLEKLFNIDLEYFEEAVEYVLSFPEVIPDRCGVMGNCLGAIFGNLMGIQLDKVKAVMAINSPFNSAFSNVTYKNKLLERAILLEAKHFTKLNEESDEFVPTKELRDYLSNIDNSYANQLPLVAKDTFFSLEVAEDESYHSRDGLRKFMNKFDANELRNVSCTIYPNAGHIIDAPYSPTVRSAYVPLWTNQKLDPKAPYPAIIKNWGGTPEGDVQMEEIIWEKSFNFFTKHIRDESEWYQNWLSKHGPAVN